VVEPKVAEVVLLIQVAVEQEQWLAAGPAGPVALAL
jgi:hypothetical protein